LSSNTVVESLAKFSIHKKFKGVRHILQAEDNDFMLREEFQKGISQLQQYNLVYELLVVPTQLPNAIKLVNKFPNQVFVLDHMAKPLIKTRTIEPWKLDIEKLAKYPNVYCKISGLVTEADLDDWEKGDFTDYLNVIFTAFGADRVLFGSDWPVCLLAADYKDVLDIITSYISTYSAEEQRKIMGENAVKLYQLS